MTANSSIKDLARGFCLGVANIIPGVSGGTFLLIFGIYERVFAVLGHINRPTVTAFLRLLVTAVHTRKAGPVIAFFRERDFFFLLRLLIGTLAAILSLSAVMKYLLLHQFIVTYSLFFGLILVSVILPLRMFKGFHWAMILLILLGAGLTIGVSSGVNPYDKIKLKSDHLASQYDASTAGGKFISGTPKESRAAAKYGVKDFIYIGICGAVAISATVLPGVSGALVLILMGAYFDVIAALSDLRALHVDTLAFLASLGIGVVVGGLLFARLVNYVLARFYNATMAFLTGLMVGSLYALWPFKEVVVMGRQFVRQNDTVVMLTNVPVYTNINRLPQISDPLLWVVTAFIAGCLIMAAFIRQSE